MGARFVENKKSRMTQFNTWQRTKIVEQDILHVYEKFHKHTNYRVMGLTNMSQLLTLVRLQNSFYIIKIKYVSKKKKRYELFQQGIHKIFNKFEYKIKGIVLFKILLFFQNLQK